MGVANELDIVVVDKKEKKEVVIDFTIPSDSNIRKKERRKLEKYQGLKGAGKGMGSEVISGTSGDWSSQGCDPQVGRVAPTNPRNNI